MVWFPAFRTLLVEVGDVEMAGGLAHCPLPAPVVAGSECPASFQPVGRSPGR